MDDTYRRLWILLRERLTKIENGYTSSADIIEREMTHDTLTLMAEMEATEFLED